MEGVLYYFTNDKSHMKKGSVFKQTKNQYFFQKIKYKNKIWSFYMNYTYVQQRKATYVKQMYEQKVK